MASHQLRTPLTSVKGYLSMVLDGDVGKISKPQKEMLAQAFFSSQRMVYLIADLLNVSRLKTGKFIIEPGPVNLAEMVDQELSQLDETASSKSLTLTYDKPKSFPVLMLDETKTRQVIMNFVDNAIYYTPAGGKINVRLIDNPNTIELRVEDNGIGVPKDEEHHLFTKFYRAGNARKARPDGTGLGLFMAKKVVIAEGGSIIFESTEGKGSTFGFVFPKAKLTPRPGTLPVKEENKELTPV
jgi:signal transduction histidine kinase